MFYAIRYSCNHELSTFFSKGSRFVLSGQNYVGNDSVWIHFDILNILKTYFLNKKAIIQNAFLCSISKN